MRPLFFARLQTPIGDQWAVRTERGLAVLTLPTSTRHPAWQAEDVLAWRRAWKPECRIVEDPRRFSDVRAWLKAYFKERIPREGIPVDLHGTPFQMAVWDQIGRIPYGRTRSYGEIAVRIGRTPSSARAVGGAVGANPVPLLVPCHRVVGEAGTMVGYGGGLELKERLLTLEGILLL